MILDSGSKTLTNDLVRGGAAPGYGVIQQALDDSTPDDRFVIERLSEEHATVRVVNGTTTLVPGTWCASSPITPAWCRTSSTKRG